MWTVPHFQRSYYPRLCCDFVPHSDSESWPCSYFSQHLCLDRSPYWRFLKIRPHRNRTATACRPLREIAAVCDLVTPDRVRQIRAAQCKENPSSWGYKVVSICFRLGYFSLIHDVQFRCGSTYFYSGWPASCHNMYCYTVQLIFQWILPLFRTARLANLSKTQMSAASARLLFDGDDAILHNTVRTPSRRGHRSLPAFCFIGMMQSYIIQFERLPVAGTDRCTPSVS